MFEWWGMFGKSGAVFRECCAVVVLGKEIASGQSRNAGKAPVAQGIEQWFPKPLTYDRQVQQMSPKFFCNIRILSRGLSLTATNMPLDAGNRGSIRGQ